MMGGIICLIMLLGCASALVLLLLVAFYMYLYSQNCKKLTTAAKRDIRRQARREREAMEKYYLK